MGAGLNLVTFVNENGIKFDLRVDDGFVDKAEQRENLMMPAAITLFDDPAKTYWCVFRSLILNATPDVLRTITWHEAIHVWVHPILYPAPHGYKKTPHDHFQSVMEMRSQYGRQPDALQFRSSKAEYEEALVKFISTSWGRDEDGARAWVLEQPRPNPNNTE